MHCIANLTDIVFFALPRGTGWWGGGGVGVVGGWGENTVALFGKKQN